PSPRQARDSLERMETNHVDVATARTDGADRPAARLRLAGGRPVPRTLGPRPRHRAIGVAREVVVERRAASRPEPADALARRHDVALNRSRARSANPSRARSVLAE